MSLSLPQVHFTKFAAAAYSCGPFTVLLHRHSNGKEERRGAFEHGACSARALGARPVPFSSDEGNRMTKSGRALLNRRIWPPKRRCQFLLRSGRSLNRLRQAHPDRPYRRPDSDWPIRQSPHFAPRGCSEPNELGCIRSSLGRTTHVARPSPAQNQPASWLDKTQRDGLLGLIKGIEWTQLVRVDTDRKRSPSTLLGKSRWVTESRTCRCCLERE